MITTLTGLFRNKEIRNKILFTLGILFIFRFGSSIPVPGVDTQAVLQKFNGSGIFGMMNLLGGGAMEKFSIFALGIGPYITASIVIQLLSMDIIPPLAELSKQGASGKKQLDRYTRYLGVVLCFVQAFAITYTFNAQYGVLIDTSVKSYIYIITLLTAGSMFLLWLGDRISVKGIGNGISMIIFAGIVANLPANFMGAYATFISAATDATLMIGIFKFIAYLLVYILIVVLVVYISTAVRKIPIQYTSSAIQDKPKKDMTYLPLKINSASVIPVIFASALMIIPGTIASFLPENTIAKGVSTVFDFQSYHGLVIYVVMIIAFTFFYTKLQMDPEKIAENLGKSNSYIPGIRPGVETKEFINTVLCRITVFGAISLAFVALLPHIVPMVTNLPASLSLGGTGLIIVVGVAMETTKQLTGKLTQKSYRGFLQR